MVKKKVTKLSKWAKIGLWVVGILVGLIVLTVVGLKFWVSTWPEYKGDGFSFRYPKGWYIDNYNYKSDATYNFQISVPPIIRSDGAIDGSNQDILTELTVYDIKNIKNPNLLKPPSYEVPHLQFRINSNAYLGFFSKKEINYWVKSNTRVYNAFTITEFNFFKLNIFGQYEFLLKHLLVVLSLKY